MKLRWLDKKREEARKFGEKAVNDGDGRAVDFWLGYKAAIEDVYREESRESMLSRKGW